MVTKTVRFYYFAVLLVLNLLACNLASAQSSQSETQPVPNNDRVVTVRHLETGEPFDVKIEAPSKASLDQFRPSNITRERITQLMKFASKQTANASVESVHEFPIAAAAFYGGSFILTMRKLLTNPEDDPTAIATFLTNQIYDPVSHFSFLVFLAAHKSNDKLLEAFGARMGLVRGPKGFEKLVADIQKEYPNVQGVTLNNLQKATPAQLQTYYNIRQQAEALMPEPKTAKPFRMAKFSTGMAAGFLFSGIAADFVKDPMIQHCFITPTKKPSEISKEIAKYGMTTTQACDIAYDTWVSTGKIMNYVPDVVSALVSAGVLARLVPTLKNRLATIAIRGIRIFRVVGSIIPQTRLVIFAESAYYFLELNQFVLPYIKDPWESWRRSGKIVEEYQKFNQLIYGPRFPAPCMVELERKFKPEMILNTPVGSLVAYLNNHDSSCGTFPLSPIAAMNNLNHVNDEWRSYWFSSAKTSLEKWQQDLFSLQSNYEDSKAFQKEVLALIKKNPNATAEDVKPIIKKYDLEKFDDSFPTGRGRVVTRNRGEFFLIMMVCGVMEKEHVLQKFFGFEFTYRPFTVSDKWAQSSCQMIATNKPNASYTRWDDGVRTYKDKSYPNLFEILKVAVKKELLNEANFEKHWAENVEAPIAAVILEKLEDYKKISVKISEALSRSDVKATDSMNLPYGVIDHLDFQLTQLERNLQSLGVKGFYEDYTGFRRDFIFALKNPESTKRLEDLIIKFEQGDLMKLALANIKNPESRRYIILQLTSRIMSQRLKDSTEAYFKKMTGQNQDLAFQVLLTATGLIESLPDTQIYRLALVY